MDLRKLKTLIDLVSESGVAELEITEGEDRVRIVNRTSAPAQPVQSTIAIAPQPQAAAPAAAAPAAQPAPAAAPAPSAALSITSPMVGTFYRAPSAPFIEVGDHVKKGQVIGIIEAMKLLNEVEADQDGVVKAFAAENGQPVEFGQPLVILE